MSNIILSNNREPTTVELNSLREKKDMLILEAICRTLGHSSWTYDEVQKSMATRDYSDGSSVFAFQGKDMLLFDPPLMIEGKLAQPVQFLYDKTEFKYMTPGERFDRGMISDLENDDEQE